MWILACVTFLLLNLNLDAQVFHGRDKTMTKKPDVYITGAWKVVKHAQWWANVRVSENSSAIAQLTISSVIQPIIIWKYSRLLTIPFRISDANSYQTGIFMTASEIRVG